MAIDIRGRGKRSVGYGGVNRGGLNRWTNALPPATNFFFFASTVRLVKASSCWLVLLAVLHLLEIESVGEIRIGLVILGVDRRVVLAAPRLRVGVRVAHVLVLVVVIVQHHVIASARHWHSCWLGLFSAASHQTPKLHCLSRFFILTKSPEHININCEIDEACSPQTFGQEISRLDFFRTSRTGLPRSKVNFPQVLPHPRYHVRTKPGTLLRSRGRDTIEKKKLFGNPGGPPEATAPSVIDGLMSFGGGKAAVQRRGILFFFSFPPLPPSPPNRFTPASSPQHRSTKTRSIHYATRSSEKFSVLYSKDAWGLLEFDRTVGGRELKVKD